MKIAGKWIARVEGSLITLEQVTVRTIEIGGGFKSDVVEIEGLLYVINADPVSGIGVYDTYKIMHGVTRGVAKSNQAYQPLLDKMDENDRGWVEFHERQSRKAYHGNNADTTHQST